MKYMNLPFKDYAAMPGLNQSKLGAIKSCPQKFKWALTSDREDTPAMALGRAIHTAVFQPELFNEEFFCLPEIDRRTTKGKEQYAELVTANHDKTVLKQDDFNKALEIATEVRSNPHVMRLLEGAEMELSLDWEDTATGVLCKGRIDCYNKELGVVVDLKTSIDASPWGFPKKIYSYGYNRQAAWYLDGLQANGESAEHFVFIAVETLPPFSMGLYRLNSDTIRLSKAENEAMLRRYVECMRTDTWPGYTNGIEDISIPEYGVNTLEDKYGTEESL